MTKSQAAAAADVTPRTLRRWLADPSFRTHLTQASDQALTDATHRLTGSLEDALTVLAELMANRDEKATTRLRAASIIIARTLQFAELKAITERVAALEDKLGIPYQEY